MEFESHPRLQHSELFTALSQGNLPAGVGKIVTSECQATPFSRNILYEA
jgi:hypothetical protein